MACRFDRLQISDRSFRHKQDRSFRENPAWLAKALAANLATMQEQVGPMYMPTIAAAQPLGKRVVVDFKEYGCGAYGCVLPTHDPKIVLKVTTDESEHGFVEKGMPWGWPAGITSYYGIMPLEGQYQLPKSRKREPAWLLWRESAEEVGELDLLEPIEGVETRAMFDERQEAYILFDLLYVAGSRVHAIFFGAGDRMVEIWPRAQAVGDEASATLHNSRIGDWASIMDRATKRTTAVDLATHLEAYHQVVRAMEKVPTTSAVGLALSFYAERRLVLADLHTGNFGLVMRDRPTWAITDPGHTVELPTVW